MNERIPLKTVSKILGLQQQNIRRLMADGTLDIGLVVGDRRKDDKLTYRVYRSKLAKFLGVESDHVWQEEIDDR